jgi:carbon monoxide dehydrogenase subunit G
VTVRVEESVQIDRPPAEVWDAIADYSFDLEWRKGLSKMTPDHAGGPAVGTKVHEVVRSSGRTHIADKVVTDLNPGVSYRFAGSGTIGVLGGSRTVKPHGEGAMFTYEIELQPKGALRLLRPVLGPMVRSGLKGDLGRLKAMLEEGR